MNDVVPAEDATAEALMGQIIDEFLERQKQGERPEVDEYARRYPQLAVVLRQMLPALGLWHQSAVDGLGKAPADDSDLTPEAPLGDYRLVREIGHGGMGVVYEAVQISLGRRVALKILPFAAALDAKHLQRFKNEAHAAAQLHHQNIVPVYGVGSDRGVHYYAMQFIDGQTLAAVIADLRQLVHGIEGEHQSQAQPLASDLVSGKWLGEPAAGDSQPTSAYPPPAKSPAVPIGASAVVANGRQPVEGAASDTVGQVGAAVSTENATRNPAFFRSAAQLGIQAARALEHSHSLGVVHRDIKPTNLLVDARGNLWITDFGLAHVHNETKLTLTGDIVGTLRYMSPEQALAQRVDVDQRTDLYSLGATLYELLTLEPTFAGNDRRELLRQIAFEEPRRPRQINKTIPVELETIVLKALEKNPAERYATAKEMADDLERFLKDEPIRARRPTLILRARKWARRHRHVVASALVATAAVVAIAIAALAISLGNISAALTAKSAALDREKEIAYLQRTALAGRELVFGNVGHAEKLLDDCPEHLRGWEWHFLKRQRYGNPAPLQHPATVSRVACSQDGRQIASMCMDGTFLIWDAQTGRVLHTMERQTALVHGALCRGMDYSPDNRYLAVGRHDGEIRVWEAASGKSLYSLKGHKGSAWQVAFSPDSRTLASCSSDRTVRLWDMASGKLIHTFSDHPAAVKGVAFRPDGRSVVAACDDGTVKVWDSDTEQATFSFQGKVLTYPFWAWFSPDARRLAWSCMDGVIKVWDTTTGELQIDQQSNTHQCRAVSFSPDGKRIALAGFDGTLRLLDASSGKEMLTIFAHPSLVADATFNHDGTKLVSASYDHTVRIWDAKPLPDNYEPPHCVTLRGHTQLVSGVAFSPDGRWLASCSWDSTVKLWETNPAGTRGEFALRYTLRGHTANVSSVAFSSDKRTLASGSWDKTVRLWGLEAPVGDSLTELHAIQCAQRVVAIALSPDGRRLAIGQTNGFALYDPTTPSKALAFQPSPAPVPALAFGPDSRRVISSGASDPTIAIWDMVAEKPFLNEIRHNSNPNASVAVSPDGQLVASPGRDQAAGEPMVKIWEVDWDSNTYKERHILKGHAGYVWKVTFSPDGRYLASGSWDSTVKIWNVKSGEEVRTLRGHAGIIHGLAFSPDGRRLAAASGNPRHGEVRIWDAILWDDQAKQGH
jgi:WD40 repeat protein/serine/threonine protein kinase